MLTKEIEQQFDELLAFCRKLQSANRIGSGYLVVIRNNRISFDPVPPHGPGHEKFNHLETAQEIRALIQNLRHALGQFFELDSRRWNTSDIGRMLTLVEKLFREETCLLEQGKVYNSFTMFFAVDEISTLGLLILSESFLRKGWRWQKLRMLNRCAKKFFERNRHRANFQAISLSAQTVIGIDDLRRERGEDESVESLIRETVKTDLLPALKAHFPD